MSDLVGNPEDQFSRVEARMVFHTKAQLTLHTQCQQSWESSEANIWAG